MKFVVSWNDLKLYSSSWYCSKLKYRIKITNTKLYVPLVTLSTQDDIKLLKQVESGFKRIIKWNKYLPKTTNKAQNSYLYILTDPSFQEVNRICQFCLRLCK